MYIAIGLYWIIRGFALFMLPNPNPYNRPPVIWEFSLCMVLGGVLVPARVLAKMIA